MNDITCIIPSSPIPDHPSTEMVDETIKSVRDRLPDSEIIIMFDGVRREQSDRRGDYEEYVRQMLYKTAKDPLITPLYFTEHTHQAGMTREALKLVSTERILFCEHDTPLVNEIDFEECRLLMGSFNLLRFSHEAVIPEPHWPMMLDPLGELRHIRTAQWSQRPHLARTDFYRWIIHEYFAVGAKTMIEDVMFPVCLHHYEKYGYDGWKRFKMAIYAPDPDNLLRSTNLDGRKNEKKYPMKYEYDGDTPEGAPR